VTVHANTAAARKIKNRKCDRSEVTWGNRSLAIFTTCAPQHEANPAHMQLLLKIHSFAKPLLGDETFTCPSGCFVVMKMKGLVKAPNFSGDRAA